MPPTLALQPPAQTAETPGRKASRIDALDWAKGALVLCMVVYHSINYSVYRPMAFQFLAFLPASFILIAGFLVGQVYATKYDLRTGKPYLRLAGRGAKLLVLFVVLNVGYCIVLEHNLMDGLGNFAERAGAIFLSGNGREGIYEVLLPISYFLLLAPALLWLRSRVSAAIPICAAVIFIVCVALESRGISSKNLSFLSAGLLGMAFGLVPIGSIDRIARQWFVVLGLYAMYRVCSWFLGERYPVQMFGALTSLLLLYACALHLNCASAFGRQMVLLGKYSLLGYLVQIPLIRILVHVLGGKPEHWRGVFVVTAAATVLLFLVILGIHALRRRNRLGDEMYKLVFA